MSFLARLQEEQRKLATQNDDPWRLPLERLRGKIDCDGLERVSSQLRPGHTFSSATRTPGWHLQAGVQIDGRIGLGPSASAGLRARRL